MKETSLVTTTPFEDLILGSQFVPVLAHTNTVREGKKISPTNIGIFQCRKCGATFLQEQEALCHYKFHVFESHKDYFSVVIGGLCPQRDCAFVHKNRAAIHFHCTYCSFSACEILELPLHMEEGHLSFYKEVSLILGGEDVQLNKVYKCGECSTSIKGTVSIVHHLLSHDSEQSMEVKTQAHTHMNGVGNHKERSRSPPPTEDRAEATKSVGMESEVMRENFAPFLSPMVLKYLKEGQEQIQIEINPLDLLSTLIEEDQKSDNPVLPMQHFLLGHNSGLPIIEGEAPSPSNDSYTAVPEEEPVPQTPPLALAINGFSESYYDQPAGVFQCNQCNEAFKYQYLLVAHRKQVHQGNVLTPFKCHVCSNEFALLIDLKRHMVTHSAEFTHFCQVCGHAFVDPLDLKSHLVEHGKSPGKLSTQRDAQQPHSPAQEKSKCEGCNMEFISKSELTRHIVRFQGTCNPNKAESLRCATCGEEMPSLDALKEHRRVSHPLPQVDPARVGRKGFQCDHCGKTFSCRSNLRDHLVVHTGEKPYLCDICGKAFSFIHNMKTHRLTHNQGRNEMCPYCDKAYKSKISLYYHMKKGNCKGLSTKEVPEGFRRCTECLQMFASEDRYQSHKAKGACHMSYRCVHCGIRCSSEDKLEKHIQKGFCNKEGISLSAEEAEKRKQRRRRRRREHRRKEEEPVCCERCNNFNRDCCCTFSCPVCGKRVFSSFAFLAHQRLHSSASAALRHKKERIRAAIMEKRRQKRHRVQKGESNEEVTVEQELDEKNEAPPEPAKTSAATDEDSSNSGSLTDLSTFTAPNLLKPVQESDQPVSNALHLQNEEQH